MEVLTRMAATQPKSSGSSNMTKTEAQRIRGMEGTLKDYQDEKLGIYKGQLDGMHVVYDNARAKRVELKALYEKRHKDVLRELGEMRASIDAHTQSLHQVLKQFSSDFEDNVVNVKASWRAQFGENLREIGDRNGALDSEEKRLDEAIEEERQECRRSIQEKTDELRHQISERSAKLQEQIKQRQKGNEDFLDKFRERFGELRAKLKEEAEAREARCSEERKKAKQRFQNLNEDQARKDAYARERLKGLQEALEYEQKERKTSQGTIVGNMMTFMEQFEANIVENQRKQRASQAHLNSKLGRGMPDKPSKDTVTS